MHTHAEAHRRACTAIHGYVAWMCIATVTLALIVFRNHSNQLYSFSASEIRVGQVAGAILVVVIFYAIEARLKKFAVTAPVLIVEETVRDRRLVFWIRFASFGSVLLVVALGILPRVLTT